MRYNDILSITTIVIIELFIALMAGTILWQIWSSRISLRKLLSEPNGDASLSRLQLLIFTFVIAMTFFMIAVGGSERPAFPSPIPAEVLTLLGISASSYLVSKGIQFSSPAGVAVPSLKITPGGVSQPAGPTVFTATSLNPQEGAELPPLTWSLDAPSLGALTVTSPNSATYTPDPSAPTGHTVKIRVLAQGYSDGIAIVKC